MGRFDELINGERLPILFVGSGFTKRYNVDMPSWEELLKNTFKLIGVSELQYFGIKNEILSENNCTEQELFQKLGTELERMFNVAFYQGNFMIQKCKIIQNGYTMKYLLSKNIYQYIFQIYRLFQRWRVN